MRGGAAIGRAARWFAAAGVLALALASCSGSSVEAGAWVEDDLASLTTVRSVTFETPGGAVVVSLTRPADEVEGDGPAEEDPVSVDGGGSFVGVEWHTSTPPLPTLASTGTGTDSEGQQFRLAVVADGERFRIPARTEGSTVDEYGVLSGGRGVLALPGDGVDVTDVTVELTYDGLTQSIDLGTGRREAGAAAPLYRNTHQSTAVCPAMIATIPHLTGAFGTCHVTWYEAPYHPGLGWARPGRHFLVADLGVSTSDEATWNRRPGNQATDTHMVRSSGKVRPTVQGRPPVDVMQKDSVGGGHYTWTAMVFDVRGRSGTLRVEVDSTFEPFDSSVAPDSITVPYAVDVRLTR